MTSACPAKGTTDLTRVLLFEVVQPQDLGHSMCLPAEGAMDAEGRGASYTSTPAVSLHAASA